MIEIGGLLLFIGAITLVCDFEHWQYGLVMLGVGLVLCVVGKVVMKEDDEV